MDKADEMVASAVTKEVQSVFSGAAKFNDTLIILNETFHRYGLYLADGSMHGYDVHGLPDGSTMWFPLFSEAITFALEEYKKAVQLEAVNDSTAIEKEVVEYATVAEVETAIKTSNEVTVVTVEGIINMFEEAIE